MLPRYGLFSFSIIFFSFSNINAQVPPEKGSVLLIIGTRPDSIKMAPVYHALKQLAIPVRICSTDQHADLHLDALKLFNIIPDYHLHIMKKDQDLFHITTSVLERIKELYMHIQPSIVLVQGDTTSALAAAIAAFYLKIPIGHIEAGLRTHNIFGPFPEEFNRKAISLIASYHFSPTGLATACLLKEHINADIIFNVGNTVVDALRYIQEKIAQGEIMPSNEILHAVESAHAKKAKIMVLTAHRRESFAHGLQSIFTAIKKSLILHPNLYVIYPTHPNPTIRKILEETELQKAPNILITKPLSYIDMVYLLSKADAIATDSGGLQEEAISLNKPVLVLRNETERYEGVQAGIAQLVGDNQEKIIREITVLMQSRASNNAINTIYGNGTSGKQIAHIIQEKFYPAIL